MNRKEEKLLVAEVKRDWNKSFDELLAEVKVLCASLPESGTRLGFKLIVLKEAVKMKYPMLTWTDFLKCHLGMRWTRVAKPHLRAHYDAAVETMHKAEKRKR